MILKNEVVLAMIKRSVVIDENGCWLWQRQIDRNGYGVMKTYIPNNKRRTLRAHRASYHVYVGPIPDGMTLDHQCNVARCVNPEHLKPMPWLNNYLRACEQSGKSVWMTTCGKQHKKGKNLRISKDGRRYCRACNRRAAAEYAKRKRGSA